MGRLNTCEALTRQGIPCKRVTNDRYCYMHRDDNVVEDQTTLPNEKRLGEYSSMYHSNKIVNFLTPNIKNLVDEDRFKLTHNGDDFKSCNYEFMKYVRPIFIIILMMVLLVLASILIEPINLYEL
jgi:hypothetical protein